MAKLFLQLALLTLCTCTIAANNDEVDEVCGNNAIPLCTGDFTHPNPVQVEVTCKELIDKENAKRKADNVMIKFLMINYDETECKEYNKRINNNRNLFENLYCDRLKSTTTSCSQVTSKSPPKTTKIPCSETTSEPCTETTSIPCTKITSEPCMNTNPHSNTPVICTTKKPRATTKKRRKANKKPRKNNKKQQKGNKEAGKKTGNKSKPDKNIKKKKGTRPGKVKIKPRTRKPVINHCPREAIKLPCQR